MSENKRLSDTAICQNRRLLAAYDHLLSSELKKAIDKGCIASGIWLPGLSPIVEKRFVEVVSLAVSDQNTTVDEKTKVIFKVLQDALNAENQYLRDRTAENSRTYDQFESRNLDWYIAHGQVSDNYWLNADDILAATRPLASVPQIYMHDPVAFIDEVTIDSVEAALRHGKQEVAYVPVAQKDHWTLAIFENQGNGHISRSNFNPREDGKCGDYTVSKIYTHAQHKLGRAVVPGNFLDPNTAEPGAAREQTQSLIASTRSTQSIKSPKSTTTGGASYNLTLFQSLQRKKELYQLFDNWSSCANAIIDRIQSLSDAEKAKKWQSFVDSVPSMNSQGSCASDVSRDWSEQYPYNPAVMGC